MASDAMLFSLPDFADGFDLNRAFIGLIRRNPELLQDGVVVDNVYGCFPNCALNGGRAFVRERYTRAQMDAVFRVLADLGVRPRLTLTNMLATPEHLADPYLNDILAVGSAYGAEAIVYHDFVADYVRQRYGMRCILSTTRGIRDVGEFNEQARRYDCVVLDFNHNKDRAFIDAIEDPAKVEVMVNEYCSLGCPRRREHYLHNSDDQMRGALTPYDCRADKINAFLRHKPGDPVLFTDVEVAQLHRETGIARFKIVGRGIPHDVVLESYTYYLVKPEYRGDVRRAVRSML